MQRRWLKWHRSKESYQNRQPKYSENSFKFYLLIKANINLKFKNNINLKASLILAI